MEARERTEYIVALEGAAPFLDIVFETIDAHVSRTQEEYAAIITGVDALEAGDVDHDEHAAVRLFVRSDVDADDAYDLIGLALDRIADDHNMALARQGVTLTFEEEAGEEP